MGDPKPTDLSVENSRCLNAIAQHVQCSGNSASTGCCPEVNLYYWNTVREEEASQKGAIETARGGRER